MASFTNVTVGRSHSHRVRRSALTLGAGLVVAGLLFNEWIVGLLLTDDGELAVSTRVLIYAFDLSALTLGGLILVFHRTPLALLRIGIVAGSVLITVLTMDGFLRLTDVGGNVVEGILA